MTTIRTAAGMLLLFTLLTGLLYPLAMTGIAQSLFPWQANGSLVYKGGRIDGSALIGRWTEDPKYFWPRPSATTPGPYNAAVSTGSNFGPLNPDLKKAMDARREALRKVDPQHRLPIPIDLLTASASGLDPHISPAGAAYQAARVARERGLDPRMVRRLIEQYTEGRQLGFLGEPRVNVGSLNRALDRLMPQAANLMTGMAAGSVGESKSFRHGS
ncbi:MAG: potassium-transporting ATPase subunit KdpC [Acidobacteriales bacterium]|nr:potassium-transporting ATPase subunit KdpC [Terriglobales bacterium]